METADILTFITGLVSGSLLTIGVNSIRQKIVSNQGGRLDESRTNSNQKRSEVGGDQAGRDIRK